MKASFFNLLPGGTGREIAAFHLRERRLQAAVAAGICAQLAGLAGVLCHVSEDRAVRAGLFAAVVMCAGAAVVYVGVGVAAQVALRKNRREAGRDA